MGVFKDWLAEQARLVTHSTKIIIAGDLNLDLTCGYDLLPAQREFLCIKNPDVTGLDVCVYQGGFGSGKTFIGSFLGICLAELYPGSRGLAVARTWPLLRDTTLESYFEHFEKMGYKEGRHYIWKASDKKLVFPQWKHGRKPSEILFRHLKEPWKLKSLNLGWIHVEEMSEIDESAFIMLLSRLRQNDINRYRLFGTTNPQANKGWLHKHFVEMQKDHDNPVKESISKIKVYRRVMAPSTENINLDPIYLENMKDRFDPEYYRINVLGQDGNYTMGLVVKGWSDLNEEPVVYQPDLPIHITCDFNVDPMCWLMVHRIKKEFHYFDEIVREGTCTVECVEEFAKRYPPETCKEIVINGDASGNSRSTQSARANDTNYKIMQTRLSELGYSRVRLDVRDANPEIVERVEAFNAAVCNTNGVRRIFMNPETCPRTVYNNRNLKYIEGTSVIWKPSPHDIKNDPTLKFLVHPFDAESYIVERYCPVQLKTSDIKHEDPPEIVFDV
jgi:PBSX family phage terminase large subunit